MLGRGSQIGEYRLEAHIAKGGYGQVFKARSIRTGEIVALKVLSLIRDEDVAAERLGALLQQRFEHVHGMVPKTLDPGLDDHYFYIPMEFVDAPTLSTLIQAGPLSPDVAARHAISLCEFLEKTHSFATEINGESFKRIVHGDLKPEHVFILGGGAIKVLDFGIAKALATGKVQTRMSGVTPHYAPPKRLDTSYGNEFDDMWALGVILYEMVSGHRPHSQTEDPRDQQSRLRQAIESNVPREPLPASCPMELAAIIDKLLAYQEDVRYQSAEAIKQDLTLFLARQRPRAMEQFATPATIKTTGGNGVVGNGVRGPERVVRVAGVFRRSVWLAVWLGVLLLSITLFTAEAVAWLGAERMRADLPLIDGRAVAPKRLEYERLRRWSLLHLGPLLRLDRPLKQRLMTVADGVIADYRQEEPTVAEVQWRQASDALKWALELTPHDASIPPKKLNCDAHLDRIAAQNRIRTNPAESQRLFKQAIDGFQQAARLDPRSPDPYLGLSRVYIYGLGDVDQGAAAIRAAESLGHPPGWRERAQLGDGYLRRADKDRKEAPSGPDDVRRHAIESARDDYARCVDAFTPIVGKGRAKANRTYCQHQLEAAIRELASAVAVAR